MIYSPETAIKEGWVTRPDCNEYEDFVERKFVSPNGLDFTLDHLFRLFEHRTAALSEDQRIMRDSSKIQPVLDHHSGLLCWIMTRGIYDGMSDTYIEVPEGVCAFLQIRSSFNRNGIFLSCGVYDSGFKGNLGFMLNHSVSGDTKVIQGTRIAQVTFMKSENTGMYAGHYNTEKGKHWQDKK